MSTVAAAEIVAMLAAHPLTEPLDEESRLALSTVAEVVDLDPGDILVQQDDPGDAAYLLIAGRLVAMVGGREVGAVSRGETVGEMALITGEPRSATIVARRSSRALRIGAEEFAGVVASHPEILRRLTALLVERLRGTLLGRPSWVGHSTVVGVAAVDPGRARAFSRRLELSLLAQGGRVALVDGGRGPGAGPDLYDLETTSDVVVVVTTLDAVIGETRSFDRTLLVATAGDPVPDLTPGVITDLVLVHPRHVELPSGTARWLDALRPRHHHHVRAGTAETAEQERVAQGAGGQARPAGGGPDRTVDRVARRLLHRERVLVLGGGGARGLAHLGTYRALNESGIDVDAVVGVSAGAMLGAGMAMDWSSDRVVEWAEKMLIEGGRIIDFTVPMVALSSGRRMTEGLRRGFGDHVDLEDLWRPLTTVSADLATLSVRIDDRGPLWRAVRASASVPGVFPPMVVDDAVLVDGGVVDNLPVARARRLHPGATIISSDVGRRHEPLNVDLPAGGVVGGWRTTWEKVGRRRETPSLVTLLYRLTALGGGAIQSTEGDVHIEHVLDGIGLFDFASGRPAIASGYERTMSVLAESDRLQPAPGPLRRPRTD